MKKRRIAPAKIAIQPLFIVLAFSIIFVFYYMFTNAFKTNTEFAQSQYSLPGQLRLDNFLEAWFGDEISIAFLNTFILSTGTVVLTVLFGSFAAYAFAVKRFSYNKLFLRIIVAMMYVSPMGLVIPLFVWICKLGLLDNLYVTTLIYSGFYMPFSIFTLCAYFQSIPRSVIDAARIDGCGELRMVFEIVIPLARAGLLLLAVLNFSLVWSNLLFSLIFLRSPENMTLMVALGRYASRYRPEIPKKMATLVIATVPLVIAFLAIRKQFIKGGLKGSFR